VMPTTRPRNSSATPVEASHRRRRREEGSEEVYAFATSGLKWSSLL
jgi:hypothetical protein